MFQILAIITALAAAVAAYWASQVKADPGTLHAQDTLYVQGAFLWASLDAGRIAGRRNALAAVLSLASAAFQALAFFA